LILPVVLHGRQTWSLTLREENRLRALRIFGLKRDEVAGGWRKLHNEELHNLYSSPNIDRIIKPKRIKWAGNEACIQLRRHRGRGMDNIKTNLRRTEWGGMDWTDLAQDRDQWRALVNMIMHLRVSQNVGKFLSS
ncbi:hypothetical protein B7P43_G05241, partial [Cryptotermes secundus]